MSSTVYPSYDDVIAAAERVAPHIRRTPLVLSEHLSRLTGGEIYLKLECWQTLGAFKVRGMVNRVLALPPEQRRWPLVVASSGNHGIAASWCGHRWGLEVHVFAPRTTPRTKLAKIQRYGARTHLCGDNYDQAHAAAWAHFCGLGDQAVWVDPGSDPLAIAGHGTIGLELATDLPNLQEVLVPVGSGGLMTGIGLAMRELLPRARVTGIQTEACPAMLASLRDGVCYDVYPSEPSLCEALVGGVGRMPFEMAPATVDRIVLAPEGAIARAVPQLLEQEQVLAEPSGAIGWAYVASYPEDFRGRRVAVVVSGSNIDYGALCRLIAGCEPGR